MGFCASVAMGLRARHACARLCSGSHKLGNATPPVTVEVAVGNACSRAVFRDRPSLADIRAQFRVPEDVGLYGVLAISADTYSYGLVNPCNVREILADGSGVFWLRLKDEQRGPSFTNPVRHSKRPVPGVCVAAQQHTCARE